MKVSANFSLTSEQTPTRVIYKGFNKEQLQKLTLDSCRDTGVREKQKTKKKNGSQISTHHKGFIFVLCSVSLGDNYLLT